MANKRQDKRFIYRCEAEFIVNDVTYRGIASDFSLNGLFLKTGYPPAADTVMDVLIYLPGDLTAKITGKVRRVAKSSLGRVVGASVKALRNGVGVEIIKKDMNYLHFIRALLG